MTAEQLKPTDLNFIADQLANAMEFYNQHEFIEHISSQTRLTKSQCGKLFNAYWDLDAYDRTEFGNDTELSNEFILNNI